LKTLLNPRYEVVPCEDGQGVLERARQTRPDLVLADVMMPRMDGLSLLRELREDKDLRDVPVILLSARAGEESRIKLMLAQVISCDLRRHELHSGN
jgi:CheY-like chemotaxis protein